MQPKASEHDEQVALFKWAAIREGEIPELRYLFAIPNGGHRHIAVATRMKEEGVKPGVPDLCLPVSCGSHHGLYVEMKAAGGRVRPIQQEWHAFLRIQGYCVKVAFDWMQARDVILAYLEEL